MRPMRCFDATSAGLILDGDRAVLSFRTNDLVNDSEASVVLTRDLLQRLYCAFEAALQADASAGRTSGSRRDAGRAGAKMRREMALTH